MDSNVLVAFCVYSSGTTCVRVCNPGLDGKETSYIDFKMPTRALMLLDMLKLGGNGTSDHGSKAERSICTLEDVKNAARELDLDNGDKFIEYLLSIFSGLGAVSWFPKVDKTLIVLKPQWLLNSMACVIREHEGEHSQLLNALKQDKHAVALLMGDTVKCGAFPVRLLQYIWASDKEEYLSLRANKIHIKALEAILDHHGLICRTRILDEFSGEHECFAVPALLPPSKPRTDTFRKMLTLKSARECICRFDFSKSQWLPNFIFERLQCTVVSMGGCHRVEMASDMSVIDVGDVTVLLRLCARQWCIEARTVNNEDYPHASRLMRELVQKAIDRVFASLGYAVPHNVLLGTRWGDVDLKDLQAAGKWVTTLESKRVGTARLKAMWLPIPSNTCEADCCSERTQSRLPRLTLSQTPSVLAPEAPRMPESTLGATASMQVGTAAPYRASRDGSRTPPAA